MTTISTIRDLGMLHPSYRDAAPLVRLSNVLARVETSTTVDAVFSHSWSCVRLGTAGSAAIDLRMYEQSALVRVCLRGDENEAETGGFIEVFRGCPGAFRLTSDEVRAHVSIRKGATDEEIIAAVEAALAAAPNAPEARYSGSRWSFAG